MDASTTTVEPVAKKLGSIFQEECISCGADAMIMKHCQKQLRQWFQTLMENTTLTGPSRFSGMQMRGHAERTNSGHCLSLGPGSFHDGKDRVPWKEW
eukprot:6479503-Amphidinium_carterae.1